MEYLSVKMIRQALQALRKAHETYIFDIAKESNIPASYFREMESSLKGADFPMHDLNVYATHFNIPVSSIIFIAEQLENARQGVLTSPPRRHATKVLQIELEKAELANERKQ